MTCAGSCHDQHTTVLLHVLSQLQSASTKEDPLEKIRSMMSNSFLCNYNMRWQGTAKANSARLVHSSRSRAHQQGSRETGDIVPSKVPILAPCMVATCPLYFHDAALEMLRCQHAGYSPKSKGRHRSATFFQLWSRSNPFGRKPALFKPTELRVLRVFRMLRVLGLRLD